MNTEHLSKWKFNDAIADQCKQRRVLCHCHIGLVRDYNGHLVHRFSKCSVRSPRAPRAIRSLIETLTFIFRNLLWDSLNYGQSLHGLHNTKSFRTPDIVVNQPCFSVFEKCWQTTLGNEIGTIRKANKLRTQWWKCTDENACLCTHMNGSNLIEVIWCG